MVRRGGDEVKCKSERESGGETETERERTEIVRVQHQWRG